MKKPLVGFVGQGYVGKAYADDFERRRYQIVRYSKEPAYIANRHQIALCDVVFIAVPTPTTKKGFDISIVDDALSCVGAGKIAVIKSTILPGTVRKLQKKHRSIFVMHSPEFLREVSAARDVAAPERNIVGVPALTARYIKKAKEVLSILPRAPYEKIMESDAAELVKYAGNCFLYAKVIYANLLFDLSRSIGVDWNEVSEALGRDSRIGMSHLCVTDSKGRRGAGGHCFIKDFAAFEDFYGAKLKDQNGRALLQALSRKNVELLRKSKKDLDLLNGVYGKR